MQITLPAVEVEAAVRQYVRTRYRLDPTSVDFTRRKTSGVEATVEVKAADPEPTR